MRENMNNNIRDFSADRKEWEALNRSGNIAAFCFVVLMVIAGGWVLYSFPARAQSRIDPVSQIQGETEFGIDPATQIQGGTRIVEWFDCEIPEGCQGLYQIMVEHPDGSRSGPYVIIQTLEDIDYARDEPERWSERDLK